MPYRLLLGMCCANGVFAVAEGLGMFKLGAIATRGRRSHQASCPSCKGTTVGWLSGRSVGIVLASATCGGGDHFG